MLEQINTKKQGDVGMGIAIGWFTAKGMTISIPLTDSQDYDLVVEIDGQLKRVQVKTTKYKRKNYVVQLKTSGGNRYSNTVKTFEENNSDYLFILTEEGSMYLIPCNELKNLNTITLSKEKEIYRVFW